MKRQSAEFHNMRLRLGRRIKVLRAARGLTQENLASITGLDRVSIGYIEQGKRAPRLSTLLLIANGLKVKMSDLFEDV